MTSHRGQYNSIRMIMHHFACGPKTLLVKLIFLGWDGLGLVIHVLGPDSLQLRHEHFWQRPWGGVGWGGLGWAINVLGPNNLQLPK